MSEKTSKLYWSECGQICFVEGYAYGVDIELNPLCLGTEEAVKQAIAKPELKSSDPAIDQIIELERQIIAKENETDGRQPNLKKPGAFRSRPAGAFQRRETNARRSSAGKRAAVHKAQFKVPGISGRTSPRLVKTV